MQQRSFFEELKERHLYRVAVIYAATGWLLLQIADIVGESFEWPQWLMQGLIFVVLLGFPVTLLVFWMLGDKHGDGDGTEHAASSDDATASAKSDAVAAPKRPGERPSLVVLPFDCYSDHPGDNWAADALTEDLTTMIARFSEYAVIARNTAQVCKMQGVDVRALGEQLGVRYALEGSLRRLPNGVRVTAQLIEVESGTHLWAEKYDHEEDDLDALNDELCQAIALKLGNELTRAEMHLSRRRPPAEWGAWDLYQQARGLILFSGWSREGFEETIELLNQALEKDPGYAPARAYQALILALGYWVRLFPDNYAAFDRALAAAEEAISLAPDSSEVLGFSGCALSDLGHHERGITVIERALELNPANSQALAALGAAKVISGKRAEGAQNLRDALQISPADPGVAPWTTILSVAESYEGNAVEALKWAEKASRADASYFGGYLAQALALAILERNDEAQEALGEARRLNPHLSVEAATALLGEYAWKELEKTGFRLPESD